jgi:hypothetical protein
MYMRFDQKGRMLPEGVRYLNSWIDEDLTVCFQWMEAPSKALLLEWTLQWDDLVEFEILSVISSADAREKAFGT